jgi:Tfp pilus assembly protein PilO
MSAQLTGAVALFRRYPYCAICLFVAVVCGVASWFLWDSVQEQQVVLENRAKEGNAMLDTLVGGSTQRAELAAAREAARRIDDNLVGEALAENYWYFYKIQEQAKVTMPDLHELNSPLTGNSPLFRRVPYTVRANGTFDQVAAFLLAIESGPRLAKITAFGFARSSGGITLDLNLEMLGKK